MRPFLRQTLAALVHICAYTLLGLSLAWAAGDPLAPRERCTLGVALTPANFPKHTGADLAAMYQTASRLAREGVFIAQWSDSALLDNANVIASEAKRSGLALILGLSPTRLDGTRKDLDLPASLMTLPRSERSFRNPLVAGKYIETVRALARVRPRYFALATEINLLAYQDPPEYRAFLHTYRAAYLAVKQVSPETKVLLSFQYDIMRRFEREGRLTAKTHREMAADLADALDLYGITSYPCPFFANPAALPPDYYFAAASYAPRGKPVMLMEIGWPSEGCGNLEEQAQFIQNLPKLLSPIHPTVAVWSLLHDVEIPQFSSDLRSTGLFRPSGEPKPAAEAFHALKGLCTE